jgi:hypothetical protein
MKNYRKKPVVIQAAQLTKDNMLDLVNEINVNCIDRTAYIKDNDVYIKTLEGDHKATIGSFIIRGVKGEYYSCREDIFKATYEKVDD